MASIWYMKRNQPDLRVHSHLSEGAAKQLFGSMVGKWKGHVKSVGKWEVLLYETTTAFAENRADAGIYIEWLSPPSKPGKGELYVERKKA